MYGSWTGGDRGGEVRGARVTVWWSDVGERGANSTQPRTTPATPTTPVQDVVVRDSGRQSSILGEAWAAHGDAHLQKVRIIYTSVLFSGENRTLGMM